MIYTLCSVRVISQKSLKIVLKNDEQLENRDQKIDGHNFEILKLKIEHLLVY
jgi:hypothetical protein